MNVIDLLGKAFTEEDNGSFARITLEGDEGHGVYTHHVEEKNGAWQINLDANGVVQTIFLPAEPGNTLPFSLEASMSPNDVEKLLGIPQKRGVEQEVKYLGTYGPWMRFDKEDMCIHVEFHARTHLIKQVTLMLPEVAP
jgi:hypothetical protein